MSDESWVEKYRPVNWTGKNGIQGNNTAIKKIKQWAKNWEPGDKPQLLVGDPGTGKTTTAHVLANKMGLPMNETNASDERSSDAIAQLANQINSKSIDGGYQLVVIDEVDSQSARTNKTPLYEALRNPRNPVILIGNDKYRIPDPIKRASTIHEFKLQTRSVAAKLRDVADAEGLDYTDADIDKLAERGNLRAGIQDLQVWAEEGIPPGDDTRTEERSPFEVMDDLLRGTKNSDGMTPPDLVLWLDENLSNEFEGVEALTAYNTLADADKWLARAQTDGYRYWKYAGALAEQTAALRLTEPYSGWLDKNYPEWFRHSAPNATGESPEARLYRKLKSYDEGAYEFAGAFAEFLAVQLPILCALDVEDRLELALAYRLTADEMKVLDITTSQFETWAEQDVPDDRQQTEAELKTEDALGW